MDYDYGEEWTEEDEREWLVFKRLWSCQSEEELSVKAAALDADVDKFIRLYGPIWKIAE